jgi:hypothetical protein
VLLTNHYLPGHRLRIQHLLAGVPAEESAFCGVAIPRTFPLSDPLLIMLPSQPEKTGMSAADISARVRRLDALSRGLALELYNVSKADDPMLYVERREYLAAMRRVLHGVESARVVLAKAKQRIER